MVSEMVMDLGSIAGHTWPIIVVVSVPVFLRVCVTSIVLVYSVDRRDRVKAIKALAPLFSLAKPARNIRAGRVIERQQPSRPQTDRRN
jgi:hypothetical protein